MRPFLARNSSALRQRPRLRVSDAAPSVIRRRTAMYSVFAEALLQALLESGRPARQSTSARCTRAHARACTRRDWPRVAAFGRLYRGMELKMWCNLDETAPPFAGLSIWPGRLAKTSLAKSTASSTAGRRAARVKPEIASQESTT